MVSENPREPDAHESGAAGKPDDDKPEGLIEKLAYAYFSIGEVSPARRAELLAQDNPGVRIPPPLIFLVSLLIGSAIDSAWLYADGVGATELISGGALLLAGFALILWGFWVQRAAGTDVEPWKPTTAIVDTGPYNLTRNPMYLGMTTANIALAMMVGSAWAIATLAVCLIVIDRYVIDREEAYLEEKFGDAYFDYKARVRRWF